MARIAKLIVMLRRRVQATNSKSGEKTSKDIQSQGRSRLDHMNMIHRLYLVVNLFGGGDRGYLKA